MFTRKAVLTICRAMLFSLLLLFPGTALAQEFDPFKEGQDKIEKVEDVLLAERLSYGFEKSPVQVHAFLNAALWWLGDQALGSTADKGSSLAGRPTFITYSAYISVSASLSRTVFAEAEFELYKGEKGEFKVTKVRGVWTPNKYFKLSVGRDFPPIGVQDKVYYPPSRYRMFAIAPYMYWSMIRATGWWDAGIHLSGRLPLDRMRLKDGYIRLDFSVINGPGEQHHDEDNYLVNHMKPNSNGYMFEAFHDKARQPWDNNETKFFPVRLSISPLKNLEFGGSFMMGYYDDDDRFLARYIFGHLLYGGDRLTVAAEYGQLQIEVDPANFKNLDWTAMNLKQSDVELSQWVTQQSAYVSAGYKFLKGMTALHFLEGVIRFEYMDSWVEDSTNKNDRFLLWLGLRYSPVQYWVMKIAGGLQWEPGGKKLDNNMFVAETVFEF